MRLRETATPETSNHLFDKMESDDCVSISGVYLRADISYNKIILTYK